MDNIGVMLTATGTLLTLGLLYYSLRTIRLFKGSVAARAWLYISLSGLFLSTGLATLSVDYLTSLGVASFGGVLLTAGGFFLLLGLRKNFLFWSSQDHFS